VEERGEKHGVQVTRRHLGGYLRGLPGAGEMRRTLNATPSLAGNLDYLDACEARSAGAASAA
jgi:tRNA-dihydrouridine synthase